MRSIKTKLVHRPRISGEPTLASSTPIYQTATFTQNLGAENPYDYSRSQNPTREVLEHQLADLDGANKSLAYSSGIAAVNAVLGLVNRGARLLIGDDLYGGTTRLLGELQSHLGLQVITIDPANLDQVRRELEIGAELLFLECPTNPLLKVSDLAELAKLCRLHGTRMAVDNSLLSPYLQRPLDLGADLAIQSATKLLGGHSDLTAGVVSVKDETLARRLSFLQNAQGTALAPFEAWLLLRGLETLAVRIEQSLSSTQVLTEFLRGRSDVKRVHVPASGPAATVLSFETGDQRRSRLIAQMTKLFRTTVSFGGVSSSLCLPLAMSHASIPASRRAQLDFGPDLLRLSVGIEDSADLVCDLESAFDGAARALAPGSQKAESL